jgi:hypothetical protein
LWFRRWGLPAAPYRQTASHFMTQDDLERRIKSLRRFSIATFTGVSIIGVGPLLFFLTCDLLKKHPVDKETELYVLVAGTLLFFPLWGILAYWGQYRYQVLCPKCGESLVGQYPVIMSTKTCRYCHERVIDVST